MNFKLMKFLDSLIGWPLCIVCGIWVRLCRFLKDKPIVPKYERILIIKWFGIGTNIKFSPLVREIRSKYPKARLMLLTFKSNESLVRLFGYYDEIRTISSGSPVYFFIDTLKNLFRFGFKGADVVIDLEFLSKFSNLFAFLSGAPIRIGIYSSQSWRRCLINFPVEWDKNKSLGELYRKIGKLIGVEFKNYVLEKVKIDELTRKETLRILEQFGWRPHQHLIGINVNVSKVLLLRRWPEENFLRLIEALVKKIDRKKWKLVLVGSPEEMAHNYAFYSKLDKEAKENMINLTGKLNLGQFIALVDKLKFMITSDSGPLFVAALQDIPLISLWGPSSPYLHGDIALKDNHILYLNMKCSPCFYKLKPGEDCRGEADCMKDIKAEEVLKYALEIIKKIENSQ